MAKFALYSAFTLEKWNWTTMDTVGIGGSESAHIFTSQELARRGNEVISFIPFGGGPTTTSDGIKWYDSSYLDTNPVPPGYNWIVYRCPEFFNKDLPKDGTYNLLSQDVGYSWTVEQVEKIDKYICLCKAHSGHTLRSIPQLKGKIYQSSNGVRRDLIEKIEKENIKRKSNKLVYASSPDRGLVLILRDWHRILERCPDAEINIYYGDNNADECIRRGGSPHLIPLLQELRELRTQKNVFYGGRINQPDLLREWFSAGLFWYPNTFLETSCISIMEAQACGAVPIVAGQWAVGENFLEGINLQGDPEHDEVCRMSLVNHVCDFIKHPEKQEAVRERMMVDARDSFSWTKWAAHLEGLCLQKPQ